MILLSRKPRERILTTASDLFYQKGIHNVGIDEIVAKSNVAKTTLYNHFASKDELIGEVMRRRSQEWEDWFFQSFQQGSGNPKEQLLSIFDLLEEWFSSHNLHGCPFSITAAQLSDPQHPAYKFCLQPKQTILVHLTHLAKEAGICYAEDFAQQMMVLIGGVIFAVNMEGITVTKTISLYARQAATALLFAQGQQGELTHTNSL